MREALIVAMFVIAALSAVVFLIWYASRGEKWLDVEGDPWR